MGNNWKDVMSGFGWLFGGRDRKSLVQWLAGNKDMRDNPDFNNSVAGPDDPSFYSRKSKISEEEEAINVRGSRNKNQSNDKLSDYIVELDEEMDIATSATNDHNESMISNALKGFSLLPRFFGMIASNLVAIYDNLTTIPEHRSGILDQKVVALYNELIKTEADSLAENYEKQSILLEKDISSLKTRLKDRKPPTETDIILGEIDTTGRTTAENETYINNSERLARLESNLAKLTRDYDNQLAKLRDVSSKLNSKNLYDNQYAAYGLLSDQGSSELFSIHQQEATKLREFTTNYQHSKRMSTIFWGSVATYASNANNSWREYKELRGWK